jgi:type IV pilus assembly protein PilC
MSAYSFRAVNDVGAAVRGEIDAGDETTVVQQLRARGLTVLEVKGAAPSIGNVNIDFERIKGRDLSVMTRQLATMIASGLSILQALHVLHEQTEIQKLKVVLLTMRQDVEAGRSFSEALAKHPKVFSTIYVAMVRAGETGGFLEQSLGRVADQLESDESLRREVRSAMVYTAAVITFALVVMIAMMAFIVPTFANIFKNQGAELPKLTQITMSISDALRGYPWVFIGATALIVFAFRRWKNSHSGRDQWDRLRLRLPLVGEIQRKVALARWSRSLASLVSAGVPMLEAIDVTGRTAGNRVVEHAMETVRNAVQSGGTIGAALRTESVFPIMVSQMVTVGEETGALGQTLSKVADFYEDEVAVAVKSLTSVLEPAMIMIVGAMVGFIVLSMYLPMFKVSDTIQ